MDDRQVISDISYQSVLIPQEIRRSWIRFFNIVSWLFGWLMGGGTQEEGAQGCDIGNQTCKKWGILAI